MVHVDLRFCVPWDPAGKHRLGPPGSLAGPGAFLVSSEAPTFHQLRVTYIYGHFARIKHIGRPLLEISCMG